MFIRFVCFNFFSKSPDRQSLCLRAGWMGFNFWQEFFSLPSCPFWLRSTQSVIHCEVDHASPSHALPLCPLSGFMAWYLGTVICLCVYITLLYCSVFLLHLWLFPLVLQRQAIQDEIQRKKEALQEEKRRRRSQCRSVGDDKASAINTDHLGHIERSRSCSYVRNCSNSRRRWDILIQMVLRLQS